MLSTIQTTVSSQLASQSKLETQFENVEGRLEQMRQLLHGPDGSAGVAARLANIEGIVHALSDDVVALQADIKESKKNFIKFALIVISSGALSGAGASKLLALIASTQ